MMRRSLFKLEEMRKARQSLYTLLEAENPDQLSGKVISLKFGKKVIPVVIEYAGYYGIKYRRLDSRWADGIDYIKLQEMLT